MDEFVGMDQGGVLPPCEPAVDGSGEPELVLSEEQWRRERFGTWTPPENL